MHNFSTGKNTCLAYGGNKSITDQIFLPHQKSSPPVFYVDISVIKLEDTGTAEL